MFGVIGLRVSTGLASKTVGFREGRRICFQTWERQACALILTPVLLRSSELAETPQHLPKT